MWNKMLVTIKLLMGRSMFCFNLIWQYLHNRRYKSCKLLVLTVDVHLVCLDMET